MALPAGRYGVTKNQLLKIKKLPMNTIKLIEELTEKFDLLGTAAFKNSTSVVTESSDLVESGAVKDIVGWGNKNLLPYPYYDKTKTENGITFSVNTDGSITVSGTATNNAYFDLSTNFDTTKFAGMLLNGLPIVGGLSYRICSQNDRAGIQDFYDNNTVISNNGSNLRLAIRINNGTTISNPVTFYPMISKDGGAYEPYHASVEETIPQVVSDAVGWDVGELYLFSEPVNNQVIANLVSENTYKIAITTNGYAGFNLKKNSNTGANIITKEATGVAGVSEVIIKTDSDYGLFLNGFGTDGHTFIDSISAISVKHITVDEQKCDNSVIGTVEDGTTASQAYAVGTHAIRNGAFITWKNAKAQGETINDASDYTSGDVASELTPIDITSEFTFSSSVVWNPDWTQIIKIGNTIRCSLRFTTPSTVTGDIRVVIVPDKYKTHFNKSIFLAGLHHPWDGEIKGVLTLSRIDKDIYLAGSNWIADQEVLATFEYDI